MTLIKIEWTTRGGFLQEREDIDFSESNSFTKNPLIICNCRFLLYYYIDQTTHTAAAYRGGQTFLKKVKNINTA